MGPGIPESKIVTAASNVAAWTSSSVVMRDLFLERATVGGYDHHGSGLALFQDCHESFHSR